MSYLYKIISTKLPHYFRKLIAPLQRSHQYPGCFQTFRCRTTFLWNLFLPFTITELNKLDPDIKNIDSHAMFRKKLLTFIRSLENDTYGIYDPLGVILLKRLRLGFSHVRNIGLDIISLILWIRYVHALLNLKILNITFYAVKITYHFAQPLRMI